MKLAFKLPDKILMEYFQKFRSWKFHLLFCHSARLLRRCFSALVGIASLIDVSAGDYCVLTRNPSATISVGAVCYYIRGDKSARYQDPNQLRLGRRHPCRATPARTLSAYWWMGNALFVFERRVSARFFLPPLSLLRWFRIHSGTPCFADVFINCCFKFRYDMSTLLLID